MKYGFLLTSVSCDRTTPKTLFRGTLVSSALASQSRLSIPTVGSRSRSTTVNTNWLSMRYRSRNSDPTLVTRSRSTLVKYIDFFNLSQSRSSTLSRCNRLEKSYHIVVIYVLNLVVRVNKLINKVYGWSWVPHPL